jgi:hypothetical protein
MASGVQVIKTGYDPREHQEELHPSLKRFNVLVCHRRFGKTVFAINELIDRALRNRLKNPQYAYVAPFYGQAKRVAWDYFKEYTKHIPGVTTNESDLRIDIPRPHLGDRVRIMLLGAENPTAILGMYLDGVILDEFAEMNPMIWTRIIRPMLSDRNGWALFIGTPRGHNHFYEMHLHAKKHADAWFTKIFKASETGIINESELLDAKATMAPEEYEQEFECSFSAALLGAYYGKEMEFAEKESRICSVPHEPTVPVDTMWDLGMDDTTSIWFIQQVGRQFRMIDYFEDSGRGFDFYAKILKEKKYTYREHYLPHDTAVRELGTGVSREETLRSLGVKPVIIVPRQSVEDGINASRLLIPKIWFDEEKCARGITALKNYERKWDPKNKVYLNKALHNWASHAADAFRTGAMALRDNFKRNDVLSLPRQSMSAYDVLESGGPEF